MIKVGIVGGAGYTAGELIRLLIHHKKIALDFVFSTSNAGNEICSIHEDLIGEISMKFTSKINPEVSVVFLCLGHGKSKSFLNENEFSSNTKIIDLSADFRLENDKELGKKSFVYGLPELNKEAILSANYIANPGCFSTAIQLALLPLASRELLTHDIHINAVTGTTGAGVSLSKTGHFSWRVNNFSSYKVFTHQHLDEVYESLKKTQSSFDNEIYFIPNRGNYSRGIYASCYTNYMGSLDEAIALYTNFYRDAAFTVISDQPLHLKQVVNSNKCVLHLQKYKDKILITSIIDNLLKGASGQAVQNMNLLFGFDEREGLNLKATYF